MAPGVTAESEVPRLAEFIEEWGIDYPNLLYDEEDTKAMDEQFDLPGPIPVTLAFNAAGEIVDRQEGVTGIDRLREMMRVALGK